MTGPMDALTRADKVNVWFGLGLGLGWGEARYRYVDVNARFLRVIASMCGISITRLKVSAVEPIREDGLGVRTVGVSESSALHDWRETERH